MPYDPNAKIVKAVAAPSIGASPLVRVEGPDEPDSRASKSDAPTAAVSSADPLAPGWWTSPQAAGMLLEDPGHGYGPAFYQTELVAMRWGSIRGQAANARFEAERLVFAMVEKKQAGKWTLDDQKQHEKRLERHRSYWLCWRERVVAKGQSVEKVFEQSLKEFSGNSHEVTLAALAELGLVQLLDLNGVRV
jgi:hypothetical protein